MKNGDKIVEWELVLNCNYNCEYCGLLENIKIETDEVKLFEFIKMLHDKYPDTEIFLFGGEPFLHPKIEFIIKTFKDFNQPFIIQTNFSAYSIHKIKKINTSFNINISIHPSQISIEDVLQNFKIFEEFKDRLNIRVYNIDIMYYNNDAINYYLEIKHLIGDDNLTLIPVTDIGCTGFAESLKEYNKIRNNKIYQEIIHFEDIVRTVQDTKLRSKIWEDFNDKKYTTYGKTCLYIDRYFLFDPSLKMYNCCYRKINTGTCLNEACFLM